MKWGEFIYMEGNIFIYIHGILLIVTLIVFLAFLFSFLFEGERLDGLIMLISFFFMIFFLGTSMYGNYKCKNSEWIVPDKPYATEKIVSLNDNNLTNGKFYLRRGYIEENLYYQYMVQLNNGGFVANKVKSSNATLYYDTDNYRVEWYTKTKKWHYWEMKKIYNKIYIPEGSITDDYSVDLN